MQTKVSAIGQIVLPERLRRGLGIHAGDTLDATIEAGRTVLTPQKTVWLKAKIITDPVTGLPVLTMGDDAPVLTSKDVEEMLSGFP